ncbi:MAG: YidC/Oxa1 family membrane protein insertase [Chloroflexota bacterium]
MEIWQSFINLMVGLLVSLYGLVGSYGVAIIIFTIIVRLIFLPLSIRSTKSMREMQVSQAKLKPQLDALKKKYGNDRQKLLDEQNKLYKELGVNPMAGLGGCLPMFIQMPIWIALYSALLQLSTTTEFAAPFLWIPNLGTHEGFPYILTAFTGISQFVLAKMSAQPSADDQAKSMNTMMQFMMPAMMVWFATQVPSGLVLYWAASNIFQFFQQLYTTGWGDLRPKKAVISGTTGNGAATLTNGGNGKRGGAEPPVRTESAVRAEARNGRGSDGARVGELTRPLPEGSVSVKNDLRIYTLEPDSDGADYIGEGSSLTTEESIARVKGQARGTKKRKKRD